MVDKQKDLIESSNESEFNSLRLNKKNSKFGIIVSGIAHNYVLENYRDEKNPPSILKVTSYPLPEALIAELVSQVDTILVVEEGYPFIEKIISGLFGIPGKIIRGKMSGDLPITGELNPDIVRQVLGMNPRDSVNIQDLPMASRPPQLCQGCSHGDTLRALNQALKDHPKANIFSDIGCYTLGALPPYNAVDTCVCMGASVSMAKGASEVGIYPSIAVIGDSTFAHSGITPLLDAAAGNTDMTVIIVDSTWRRFW